MEAAILHGFLSDLADGKVGMTQERASGRQGIGSTRADCGKAVVRLDDVAGPAQNEAVGPVGCDQQGFQAAQCSIHAPVFGEFHGSSLEVPVILFQFPFKPFEQGEGIRRRSGKAGQDLIVVHFANLLGLMF